MEAIKPPLVFSEVALASSLLGARRRPLRWPRLQLVRVWGAWAAVRAAASEVVLLLLPSSPTVGRKTMQTKSAKANVMKRLIRRTLGGRPRFRGTAGADEVSAPLADAFLFLLPFGRPRPRLTGCALELPR